MAAAWLGARGIDPIASHQRRGAEPQPLLGAPQAPARLVGVDDLGRSDRLAQLGPGVGEDPAHPHDRLVDSACRDRDAEDLAHDVGDLSAREAVDARQGGDVGLEPWAEGRDRDSRRQLGERRLAATRAAQAMQPVLEDDRRDRRQLPLLVDQRIAEALLAAVEVVPAARARMGQVLEALVHPLGRGHLAGPSLVARLSALFSQRLLGHLTGQRAALLAGHRRIGGGRHRAVPRVAAQLSLELLDALAQRVDHPGQLLDLGRGEEGLDDRLAAGVVDRLRLLAPHKRKVLLTGEESCSGGRHPLNGYLCSAVVWSVFASSELLSPMTMAGRTRTGWTDRSGWGAVRAQGFETAFQKHRWATTS